MRRKLFLSFIAVFLLASLSFVVSVEADSLMWSRAYEVVGTDGAFSVVETSDGGYVMACITGYYYCLLKTDAFGNREWHQTYGPVGISWLDVMPVQVGSCSLVAAHDGGYAMVGAFEVGFEYGDFWLAKTDVSGNMEWNRTYGEEKSDRANALVVTSDGGYVIAGETNSFGAGADDFWLVKTDEFGNMEWNRTYGGAGNDLAYSLVEASDGGYVMAGTWDYEYIYDFETGKEVSRGDFWLVKTDASGNMEWNRTYGGTGYEWAWSLVTTSDGGYAIAGETTSIGAGNRRIWLVKTDEYGVIPEYTSFLLPSLLLVATLVIVIYKKKRST